MKNYIRGIFACLSFIFFAQFSQDSSVAGGEKPLFNFKGTITDREGRSFAAENITISGAYKKIVVYQKPEHFNTSPKNHEVKIDLAEIQEIKIPRDTLLTFNNQDFIELEIISKDTKGTKNTYLIEKNRGIFFDEPNEAGPIGHRISPIAVETITIKNYEKREEEKKVKKVAKNYRAKSYNVI